LLQINNCTAVILTGGESKRMGADKASIMLAGQSLLEHVLAQIEPLFSDMLISVREQRPDMAYPQIVDGAEERGPMVGIKAALEAVKTDWLFVIACDMPLVSTGLIQHLAGLRSQHDAVVPFAFDRPQPLFGFYHTTCLPLMKDRMKQGQRSMIRLLDDLDVCLLSEQQVKKIDPELKSLRSLDTMEDVKEVERFK
jgi:molybdopterin-guanine dinucleotide biosynthesis protein A